MRKTVLAFALAGASLVPLTGVAQAVDGANTFGTTKGNAKIVRTAQAACNPAAATSASDPRLLCRLEFTGSFQNNNENFGRNHGSFYGNVTLNYGVPGLAQNCVSASGKLVLRVYNNNNDFIGRIFDKLRPATQENPGNSRICKTGSQADSDVSSTFFVGDLSGQLMGGIDVCGVAEDRGSSIQKRRPDGTLVEAFRVASNTQANLMAGEACK